MPMGKYIRTKEHAKHISDSLKGHPMYKSTIRSSKLSASLKGNTNKRGKVIGELGRNNMREAYQRIPENKKAIMLERIRISNVGRKQSVETIEKRANSRMGYRHSEETKKKISIGHRNNGKPRKTDESKLWRTGVEYDLWRSAVFSRDGWTCQKTGIRGGDIVAHHIKSFSTNPDVRFAIDNGITLSLKEHIRFHKKYGKRDNNIEQLNEFLKGNNIWVGV